MEIRSLIKDSAKKHGLDPAIVYGVCMQESMMCPYACRYERCYRWLYRPDEVKPTICSLDTEIAMQSTSIGLMQVMGAVYREMGYRGWLSEIFGRPETQLDYGCGHLAAKIRRYGLWLGLIAYNTGSPVKDRKTGGYIHQWYADRVVRFSDEWKDEGV